MRGGQILQAEDGQTIQVAAAMEAVLEVRADTAIDLTRAAYHLGNRHVPVEVGDGFLRLEYDYVLKSMLEGLGVSVSERMSAFEPEAGAYGGGHRHAH